MPADDLADFAQQRQPRPTVQDLLDREVREVPPELRDTADVDLGFGGVPVAHYVSKAFHDLEMEKLWRKVWQPACREDELREVGDHVLYEIGRHSVIVVRAAPNEIKAHMNVCLHRGRRLRDGGGRVQQFRCPYHGFTWNLDGTLKAKPCAWDFPHVDDQKFTLRDLKVETWGGFVFVNFDPDARPLAEQLEDIPAIFARWPLEERFTAAHVAKKLPCNWKVALEAFIETLHVTDTHPQIASWIGDEHTQYDVWPGRRHYSRMISPRGVASPSQGQLTEEQILNASDREPGGQPLTVPDGSTARREMANIKRGKLSQQYGRDMSGLTDSEAVDTIQYFIFPNLVCWWGHGAPSTYRFRPLGDDPDACIMEIYFLVPAPEGREKPKPAKTTWLEFDQPWSEAKEIGLLGPVADQDSGNLGRVQQGLKDVAMSEVTLARYQENRLRHFHRTLREYIDA